jgi:isopentenyldiphosphate isomerase
MRHPDTIYLVDSDDTVIGYKPRAELDPAKDIYRVASVWITNDKNQALFAQRSFTKKIYPGVWDASVAGTLEYGESYEENAIREAYEELGINDPQFAIGPKVRIEGPYNLFIQWFFLKTNKAADEFIFPKDEVEQVRWFSKEEVLDGLKNHPEQFIAKDLTRWVEMFWK